MQMHSLRKACGLTAFVFGVLAAGIAVAQTADLILRNGKVVTVDGSFRIAQAVAVRGSTIAAVGNDTSVMALAGPATQVIDLAGRTVVPGLIDNHLHLHFAAISTTAVQLIGARSIADVQGLIAERVKATPSGGWVAASMGWHESLLAEGRMPTRWELDKVSPDNPVIVPRGGHVVTVNSKALALSGVTKETPNPTGGIIVRDPATGEATGVLLQNAANFARRVAPPPPPAPEQARLLREAMKILNSYGVVSAIEPAADERSIAVYKLVRESGEMTVRTDILFRALTQADAERGIKLLSEQKSDDMLRFVGLKFLVDGGVEGARHYEPYQLVPGEQTNSDYRGVLLLPPGGEDEYVEMLKLVARANMQAQTHGVGDEAIDVIVRSYERVNAEFPLRGRRWAVMHVFLPTETAITKMAQLDILATVQDHPVLLGHNQRRWWGDERANKAIPIRTLIDRGIHVGGGSDGPVVPYDPFLSMWWMTTRQTLNGYALGPDQAISAKEALTLYTINNAKIMGVERERGSIEFGKLADLTILSQDILSVEPDKIRDTKALMTVVGGKIVHRSGI